MFETSVVKTCARSAARNRISLMTCGHASASTQICMIAADSVSQVVQPVLASNYAIVLRTQVPY